MLTQMGITILDFLVVLPMQTNIFGDWLYAAGVLFGGVKKMNGRMRAPGSILPGYCFRYL